MTIPTANNLLAIYNELSSTICKFIHQLVSHYEVEDEVINSYIS